MAWEIDKCDGVDICVCVLAMTCNTGKVRLVYLCCAPPLEQ